ncbi:MAG: mandelate racemase/muconate lactonizing enzyme family protein [Bryobacteraceae bacterium]|nr:mandelate racemase/muconate lactonizing enzyme family protein [Bryobacteraceae bacterium]
MNMAISTGRIRTRRSFFRLALGLPAGAWYSRFEAIAAPDRAKVKIVDIRAMNPGRAGTSLLKIVTDAGLTGYGEASASGPMLRARIEEMKPLLIGQDPLAIEFHFHRLTGMIHPHLPHIPSVGAIDIALWDLAGKILNRPVYQLLGGPFRKAIPMYSHGHVKNLLDRGEWKAFYDHAKAAPEGFTIYKQGFGNLMPSPAEGASWPVNFTQDHVKKIARGFEIAREIFGESIRIAVHAHNEFDTPTAIDLGKRIEPLDPPFYEDPLAVPYSESWVALKRACRVPLLVGEKLELFSGFKPFLETQTADILHPDLVYAGGITGTRRIANFASHYRIPVALHNVGHLVNTLAAAHFGCAIQNFYRSESRLGEGDRPVERQAAGEKPLVRNGELAVPERAGLGVELNPDELKRAKHPDEPWWGD